LYFCLTLDVHSKHFIFIHDCFKSLPPTLQRFRYLCAFIGGCCAQHCKAVIELMIGLNCCRYFDIEWCLNSFTHAIASQMICSVVIWRIGWGLVALGSTDTHEAWVKASKPTTRCNPTNKNKNIHKHR
jgi:hypothetical protein